MNNFFSLSSTISRINSSEGDNGQTRNLFDEVIRKNQEITKAMLTKMTELYNSTCEIMQGRRSTKTI